MDEAEGSRDRCRNLNWFRKFPGTLRKSSDANSTYDDGD